MPRRRTEWGSVRKLPSGRYQARYRVEGLMYAAPGTFATRHEATAYLAQRHELTSPGRLDRPTGREGPLADYAWQWLKERPNLRPWTLELYESELRRHILPASVRLRSPASHRLG